MAQNYPVNHPANGQKPTAPIGGISVEHPLQATVYAYRRGKMKLLVPFEITVVPMGGLQAERPSAPNGYPYSGPIQPQTQAQAQPQPQLQPQQPQLRYPPYNGNMYGQQAGIYHGSPHYYPISNSYQQPYNPYNSYYPNNLNNGYYNQQQQQQQQAVQNPYYSNNNQPPRRAGFPIYRPQYQLKVGK